MFTHDGNGRMERAEYWLGNGSSLRESFTYDWLGRIIRTERDGSSVGASSLPSRQMTYAYDEVVSAGSLGRWTQDDRGESYTYDQRGNRLTKSVDGVLTSHYTYNRLQQLVSVTQGETTRHFTYDQRGNVIAESLGEVPQYSYTYDSTGRMVRGRNERTGEESRYTYNVLGMRMALAQDLRMDGTSPEFSFYRMERTEYVSDWLNPLASDLVSIRSGRGMVKALYGSGYGCLGMQTEGVCRKKSGLVWAGCYPEIQ